MFLELEFWLGRFLLLTYNIYHSKWVKGNRVILQNGKKITLAREIVKNHDSYRVEHLEKKMKQVKLSKIGDWIESITITAASEKSIRANFSHRLRKMLNSGALGLYSKHILCVYLHSRVFVTKNTMNSMDIVFSNHQPRSTRCIANNLWTQKEVPAFGAPLPSLIRLAICWNASETQRSPVIGTTALGIAKVQVIQPFAAG